MLIYFKRERCLLLINQTVIMLLRKVVCMHLHKLRALIYKIKTIQLLCKSQEGLEHIVVQVSKHNCRMESNKVSRRAN
jgi:hypothetical protein